MAMLSNSPRAVRSRLARACNRIQSGKDWGAAFRPRSAWARNSDSAARYLVTVRQSEFSPSVLTPDFLLARATEWGAVFESFPQASLRCVKVPGGTARVSAEIPLFDSEPDIAATLGSRIGLGVWNYRKGRPELSGPSSDPQAIRIVEAILRMLPN